MIKYCAVLPILGPLKEWEARAVSNILSVSYLYLFCVSIWTKVVACTEKWAHFLFRMASPQQQKNSICQLMPPTCRLVKYWVSCIPNARTHTRINGHASENNVWCWYVMILFIFFVLDKFYCAGPLWYIFCTKRQVAKDNWLRPPWQGFFCKIQTLHHSNRTLTEF